MYIAVEKIANGYLVYRHVNEMFGYKAKKQFVPNGEHGVEAVKRLAQEFFVQEAREAKEHKDG